ncbi:hypothetical protein [Streptosporangium lutulentum]|uniref:Uncharacterized protein n=1 Tax=Streptosporangium lutulentum TaxID=1461250 RepID=A0ABT9QI93_9ACTN|nr:hypothetical protein [Streptosporangium lutulentum]MDP9846412.1 hypothetical protein [Streptosporangium lutulentum]
MRFIARIWTWTGAGALAAALIVVPSVTAEAAVQAGNVPHVAVAAAQSVIVAGDGPGSNHRRSRGGAGLISRDNVR